MLVEEYESIQYDTQGDGTVEEASGTSWLLKEKGAKTGRTNQRVVARCGTS